MNHDSFAAKPTRAVIFDVDGTLITDTIHHEKHNFIIGQRLRRPDLLLTAEEWRRIRGLPDEDAYHYVAGKAMCVGLDLVSLLPCTRYLAAADSYVNAHTDDIRVRAGVREVLATAEQLGLVLGVATNAAWPETERKLAATGLVKYFQFFSCLDGSVAPKPAPGLYVRGIRLVREIVRANIDPAQVIAVEDSGIGAAAALSAGCRVIVWPCDGRGVRIDNTTRDRQNVLTASSTDDSIQYIRTSCDPL